MAAVIATQPRVASTPTRADRRGEETGHRHDGDPGHIRDEDGGR